MHEESNLFSSLEQGCPVHGDEYVRECSMCGCEYCRSCNPSPVCPECAAQQEVDEDDELEKQPDFEDVKDLNAILENDEEAEKLVEEEGDPIPLEDLVDDEADAGSEEEEPRT